jgi:AcrR family transcriptional regulator
VSYVPPFPGRDELLTLAMLELARERGVHDMTIRTLAAAVRAAPGSLTYHHGGKDAMFAACARFLGYWLFLDMQDRVRVGGWPALLPDPGMDDDSDELEYGRRLRVWLQLSAYALDSPTVAAVVRACEDRIMTVFSAGDDVTHAPAARELVQWAVFKTLAMTLLLPDATLTRDAVLAATGWTGP